VKVIEHEPDVAVDVPVQTRRVDGRFPPATPFAVAS
jgi:hypothetical protein